MARPGKKAKTRQVGKRKLTTGYAGSCPDAIKLLTLGSHYTGTYWRHEIQDSSTYSYVPYYFYLEVRTYLL